jgi:hypothetical protein
MLPSCFYVRVVLKLPGCQAGTHAAASGSIWATDVPGWITAAATAMLALFAVLTAYYARQAFLKQSKEVSDEAEMLRLQSEQLEEQRKINAEQTAVLKLQAAELRESLDEREREAEQRHRAQASRVFITQELSRTVPSGYAEREHVEPFVTVTVVNSSEQPVYDAEIRWHIGTADHEKQPNPEPVGTVMPGKDDAISRTRPFPYGVDMNTSGADVRFTDAAGTRWLQRPNGDLDEISQT